MKNHLYNENSLQNLSISVNVFVNSNCVNICIVPTHIGHTEEQRHNYNFSNNIILPCIIHIVHCIQYTIKSHQKLHIIILENLKNVITRQRGNSLVIHPHS